MHPYRFSSVLRPVRRRVQFCRLFCRNSAADVRFCPKNLPENGQNTASACPNYSNRTAHRGGQCENIIIACVNFFHAFNAAKTSLPCLCLVAGTLRSSAALRRNNNPAIRLFALAVGGNIGVVLQSGMQNPALIGIHGFKSPRPAR